MDAMEVHRMHAGEVAGLGVVGAFGSGRAALRAALNGCPPRPVTLELHARHRSHTVVALPADVGPLGAYFPKTALRRLDHFSRLALLAACQALESGGCLALGRKGSRVDFGPGELGLVLATGYGATGTTFAFLDSILDDGDSLASPTLFSHSVHNAAAANIAMLLGITGPCLTVSQFELSFASALCSALVWLREGRVRAVLLGAVDEVCDVLGYCHARFFGEKGVLVGGAHEDVARRRLAPGEGAAFFLLRSPLGVEKGVLLGAPIFGRGEPWKELRQALHGGAAWILGTDGHAECETWYGAAAEAWPTCASYAPQFGCMPTGQGLDAAVGVLALEQGNLFPNCLGAQTHAVPLRQGAVWCLKTGQTHQGVPPPWAAVPVCKANILDSLENF